jgi:hypothetical protein
MTMRTGLDLRRLTSWTLCMSVGAGCGGPSGPGHRYDEHLAAWKRAAVTSYSFTFRIGGQTGPHAGRVTVQSGHVVAVAPVMDLPSEQPVQPLSYPPIRPTIEDVWALLRKDLTTADRVEVSYDEKFGFPTHVDVDREKSAIDDEYGYGVTDFLILAPKR